MSRQPAESEAPDSSESRAPPRENDLSFEELEEGQVDYEESVTSEAHSNAASARSHTSGVSFGAASARSFGSTTMLQPRRVLRTPNPFVERYNPVRVLRDAPPLTSRYEEDRRDPNVISNDLDEAQSRQLSTEQARSGPTVPWPGHSPFRRGATMASSLWILRRPHLVLRSSSWTLMCVGHQPLRLISKCDGTRSASAS
ncbi:hypothetical protein PI124_g16787 [Phytophthora idaei]|nr:hypothetical protein PI125_g20087 [Phytophthora idaei]KAG3136054.1 hypothetical protein PI126_g17986 [Phytophthora idaei]KAG3238243.1 hypothetical protein PI124_g16787 [Phytophthora idaei]